MIDTLVLKGDRVLVKQVKSEEKVGSFYIPESVMARREKRRRDAWKAEVCGIGDGVVFEKHQYKFKKGDIVYCSPVSLDCPSFEENGGQYLIITQEDLIAVAAE